MKRRCWSSGDLQLWNLREILFYWCSDVRESRQTDCRLSGEQSRNWLSETDTGIHQSQGNQE